ncbi:MAG: hypothetical protein MI756_10765 [Chromatiales bacterium]|nr:hypothetical protein [Chromatiales bacterium]
MADETNSADESVEKQPEKTATTVKKKAAKKKVAKKKVAKKKATTKKKAAAKKKVSAKKTESSKAASAQNTTTAQTDKPLADSAAKAATPTTVAAASAQASSSTTTAESNKAPSSNVVVQKQIEDKDKTLEETPMSTETKSSGGFWIKVIFWLIIIILGFMYIRSLAKNPVGESTGELSESAQVEVATSESGDQSATDEATASTAPAAASGEDASATQQASVAEAEGGQSEPASAGDASDDADGNLVSGSSISPEANVMHQPAAEASSGMTDQSSADTSVAATQQEGGQEAATAQDKPQSVQDMHAESVTKILKEFDELRDAAQAEMEAMQNRMQAERELHEAMMPPPPRMWRNPNPGYGPYGPGPYQGYYNYR